MSESLIPPACPENAVYTSCWCEENVYLLGKQMVESLADFATTWDAYAIFISNESKTVAICQAKTSTDLDPIPGHSAVLWDYHVILVLASKSLPRTSWVYDFDSRLPMGCPFREYIRGTFPIDILLGTRLQSWFRAVELQNFLDHFASDRSHMLRSEFGEDGADGLPVYLSPPPAYPPIRGNLSTSANNLFACYVDMSPSELKCEPSELDLDQLRLARFGHVVTLGLLEAVFESEK